MENPERTPASGLPIAHRGLRHLALRVRDVAAARKFYSDVFGMRPLWEPDAETAYLSSGRDNLALHAHAEAAQGSDAHRALDHLGFLVATPAEVYAAAAAARAAGVRILQEAREHRDGSHSFYIADPDGNVVQILFEPNISPLL
jgi:catechol 2,3-dioxygenase-like lactoylglutathione lyase family enzyme